MTKSKKSIVAAVILLVAAVVILAVLLLPGNEGGQEFSIPVVEVETPYGTIAFPEEWEGVVRAEVVEG